MEELSPAGQLQQKTRFTIKLNPDHPVYKGHFPGNPVTPGVCQIAIIQELVAVIVDSPLRLISADNIKYPALMVPSSAGIECDIMIKQTDDHKLSVTSSFASGETIFVKFKGIFTRDEH